MCGSVVLSNETWRTLCMFVNATFAQSRRVQLSAARAILCRVCSSCRPQLGLGLWFWRRVCVCECMFVCTPGVCGTSTAAAGAFTNVKRLSVFVSSGTQLMRAKLKIHCTVSVCVERAQKEETKIESRDCPCSFSPLYLPLSVLGCSNEMWASCRTMKRGSGGCFFSVPLPQCASFNLMFQCKSFFHLHPSRHVCNMAGCALQPLCHYGYYAQLKCAKSGVFHWLLSCLLHYGYVLRKACKDGQR